MTAIPSEMSDIVLTEALECIDAVIREDASDVYWIDPVDRPEEIRQIARYASLRRGPIAAEMAARHLLVR